MFQMGLPYKLKRIDDPDKGTRTYVEDGILAGLAGLIPVLVLGALAWKGIQGHYFSEDGTAYRGPSEVSTIVLAIAAVAMLICCVWCFAWRRRLVFDLRTRELRMAIRGIVGTSVRTERFESLKLSVHKEEVAPWTNLRWTASAVHLYGPGLSVRLARMERAQKAIDYARDLSSVTGIPLGVLDY